MHLFVIFSILLFWIFIVFIVKTFHLEKEGIVFLISYPIAIYLILNFKEFLHTLKHRKLIYIFYKNHYSPHYFNYLNSELFLFKKFLIQKLNKYLKEKPIIDKNSIFLNRYFFALELSIQKQNYFYSLNPLPFSSEYYKIFNLNLTLNDIKILLRNTIDIKQQNIIEKTHLLTYKKPGDQPLDVSEITHIFYEICKFTPSFQKILKQHYNNYFQGSGIKIKLLLSISENLKFNHIFNLIFLLDSEYLDHKDSLELQKEQQLFQNSEKNICFSTIFSNQYANELAYQYVPLNFIEILKVQLKNNLFIEELSNLIKEKKELYCQPTFVSELDNFIEFINSLRLVNQLNEQLKNNILNTKKVIKI